MRYSSVKKKSGFVRCGSFTHEHPLQLTLWISENSFLARRTSLQLLRRARLNRVKAIRTLKKMLHLKKKKDEKKQVTPSVTTRTNLSWKTKSLIHLFYYLDKLGQSDDDDFMETAPPIANKRYSPKERAPKVSCSYTGLSISFIFFPSCFSSCRRRMMIEVERRQNLPLRLQKRRAYHQSRRLSHHRNRNPPLTRDR